MENLFKKVRKIARHYDGSDPPFVAGIGINYKGSGLGIYPSDPKIILREDLEIVQGSETVFKGRSLFGLKRIETYKPGDWEDKIHDLFERTNDGRSGNS